MTRQRALIVHVLVPLAVGVLLLGLYFSRVPALQRLVSPKLPPLPENTWREYGLLENLQNGLLLAMLVLAARGAARARGRGRRWALAVSALLIAFVLLEETDYGAHAWRWLRADDLHPLAPEATWSDAERQQSSRHAWFNLHTGGERFKPIKKVVDGVVVVFFVLLPLIRGRIFSGGVPAWVPGRGVAAVTVVGGVVRVSAHALAGWDRAALAATIRAGGVPWETGSMSSNLSEFGETFLYYGALLYLAEQIRRARADQSDLSIGGGAL